MFTYSIEHENYLKRAKKTNRKIKIYKIAIIILFLSIWEILYYCQVINSFLYSSPSLIIINIINLIKNGLLFNHIKITIAEIIISFILTSIISIILSSIMWFNKNLAKIIEPFLIIINSLPKVALGPLFIIWIGANIKSIIFMSITISIFTTIINLYQSFITTNNNYITLLKTFKATKKDILFKIIYPANLSNIISTLKINMNMTFIGVIMGELLVSKEGLGYLIMYGSQVFNITLIISSVIIIGLLAALLNSIITYIEKKIIN